MISGQFKELRGPIMLMKIKKNGLQSWKVKMGIFSLVN